MDVASLNDGELLQSWKTIAQFFKVSVRTIQRWESQYNLPIRRLPNHSNRTAVFAVSTELRDWYLRHLQDKNGVTAIQANLQKLFWKAEVALILLDDSRKILDANHKALSLFGAVLYSHLGLPIEQLAPFFQMKFRWDAFLGSGEASGSIFVHSANGSSPRLRFGLRTIAPRMHLLTFSSPD